MFKILKIGLSFLSLLAFASSVQAATPLDVVINEIAWMGTEISYNDEWIELYNNTDSSIDLEGWVLKTVDGTPEINLSGIIPANGFYLLERTDDETLPGTSADLIYKGALKNSGEDLKLYDNSGKLIDEVNCSDGWLAGDNETKQTMERTNSGNWGNSKNPEGTPKAKNSTTPEKLPEDGPRITEKEELEEEPMSVSYPTGIVFSEILPSPEGPDAENEWIEISNQNDFDVNLSGWQITDTIGRTKVYTFPQGTVIEAKGFLVLPRPLTKITLNNSEDNLNLFQPNGNIIDKVSYKKAPRGESSNKTSSGWLWSSTLTPGASNIIPSSFPSEESQEKTELLEDKTSFGSKKEQEIAAVGEFVIKSSNPLSVLLIALIIAFFSGIIILLLKKFTTPSSNLPEQNE